MKRLITYILAFITLWAIWFVMCPHYLQILEGFDFYTSLPDFTSLNLDTTDSVFRHISSYLLQFYASPAAGAAIQALLTLLIVLCIDLVVGTFFKESDRLLWIPFPVMIIVSRQLATDISPVLTLKFLAIAIPVAILISTIRFRKNPFIQLPGILRNICLEVTVIVISLVVSAFSIHEKIVKTRLEEMAYMDHLVENRQWDRILDEIPAGYARENTIVRRYALLALSEKGQLADKAISYGLSSPEDFFFKNTDQALLRNFNMRFYHHLGMYNTSVYYAFQQATQFHLSMCFNSARYLADAYLKMEDYTLANKYIEILRHSTCHKKWIKDREEKLQSIKGSSVDRTVSDEKYLWGEFIPDMNLMIEKYPSDPKYRNYLMCALLSEKDVEQFYSIFKERYAEGDYIPLLYQEALLTITRRNPEDLGKYRIDDEVLKAFDDFTDLLVRKKETYAKRKYADTYWAYLIFGK